MNYILFSRLSIVVIAETYLILANLEARVFNTKYFSEANGLWRRFDKKGPFWTIISLFIHIIIVFGAFLIYYQNQYAIGVLSGCIILNATFDRITIKQHHRCLKSNCENLPNQLECVKCRRGQ